MRELWTAALLASTAMMGQANAEPAAAASAAESAPAPKPCPPDPASYYPDRALVLGRGGNAVIRCTIGEDGHYKDCAILSETPTGFGFGQGAVRASCRLAATPGPDGKISGVGTTIDTRMVFKPPKQVCRNVGPLTRSCEFVWPD